MAFEIRLSRASDAEGCLAVYAPYVLSSAISFESEPPSVEEFRRRIESISARYPYIVCLEAGRVIGYAYAHRHKERAAYQWNAELSVYLDGAYRRRGLGRALYGALMDILLSLIRAGNLAQPGQRGAARGDGLSPRGRAKQNRL